MSLPKALKTKIPKAKDCRLSSLRYMCRPRGSGWDMWMYFVPCLCCGVETKYHIRLYDSGRYWLTTERGTKVGWGKTLTEAKRKARELDRKAWWDARLKKMQEDYDVAS